MTPRLTLLVLAINAEKELARILPQLLGIADELVIGVDDTTGDATAEVARQFTNQIHPVPHEGFRGRGRPHDLNAVECMLPYCHGDWLLRIDQDETLSALWHDRSYVSGLLEEHAVTQYFIPRRHVLPPGDRYVASGHWFPDYQLRLYRNIPSLIEFNRRPHDRPRIAGEQRFLSDSWIMHWDTVWYDRARREQKVAFYWEIGYSREEYRFEPFVDTEPIFRTRPLDFAFPQPSPPLMAAAVQDGPFSAALEALDYPDVMLAGRLEPVLVGIKNCSNRAFRPSSIFIRPANVLLSYHWYRARDREIYQWDFERYDLPRPLAVGEWTSHFIGVAAPQEPGDYLLQPDLVEESVAWFSAHCPMPAYPVRVIAQPPAST